MTIQRQHWLWMIPILLLTVSLSATHLNDDAIWFDEWITYFITGTGQFESPQVANTPCSDVPGTELSPVAMLCVAAIDNSWPPAFFSLLSLWDLISGGFTFADRVLALLIGLLAVSVTYRLGKRLFSRDVGLAAAALLATSAFLIFYMHEVRGYTLYVLMPALSAWFYWLLLMSPHFNKRWLRWGFVAGVAITLYTHYIAAAAVLGLMIYHVLYERKNNRYRWSRILRLWVNGCLFFAPWVAVLIISFINESITQRSIDTLTLLRGMLYAFSNNLWWLVLPTLLMSFRQWRTREMRFLWVWGLTILAVAIAGNIFANFLFHPRHIIGMLPAFVLIIAATLVHYRAWVLVGIWIGAGVIASSSVDFIDALPRHISTVSTAAMQTIVDTSEQCVAENDLLVLGIDEANDEWIHDQPLTYYLGDTPFNYVHLGSLVTDAGDNPSRLLVWALEDEGVTQPLPDIDYAQRIALMTTGVEHVWLLTRQDLPIQREMAIFDDLLRDAGFNSCGIRVDANGVLGRVYGHSCDVTCDVP